MHHKTGCSFLIYLIAASKVQSEENTSKQSFIYLQGLAKVNFYTKKEWSYVGCMEHCKKLGGRAPPVRTLQEWRQMEGMVNDLLAFTPSPDLLYLSETRGKPIIRESGFESDDTLPFEHWPQDIAESDMGVWRDYYTGEPLENYNRTRAQFGSGHCSLLAGNTLQANKPPFYEHMSSSEWGGIRCNYMYLGIQIWCPCLQESALLLRGTCSSSNLRNFGRGLEYFPQHMPLRQCLLSKYRQKLIKD